jgi:KDO2-lipid IV(A) lauroyltransferase
MRCWFVPLLGAVAWLVGRAPQRLLIVAGHLLARAFWWPLASRRRIARINVGLCLPEVPERRRHWIADRALINSVVGTFELMKAWHAPARSLRGLANIEGLEHLRAALARGQGVLLITGHFTHTEIAMRLVGEAIGRPVRYVVRPHNNACLQAWMEASRQKVFGQTLGKKKLREPLTDMLLAGEPVCYLADQNFSYQHAFVPFFGVPAATLTATPEIAARGNAAVLPFWYRRERDGTYSIRIEAQWSGWPGGDAAADAARYMAELETAIRECPEQYLWTHQRFKTRPEGEASPYEKPAS